MVAISRFVLRHKGAVLAFWLVVLVAGGVASAKLGSRLSPQFALPGAPGYQANQQILRLYGNGGNGYPEVAVVRLPPGQNAGSPAARQALGRAFAAVTAQVGGAGALLLDENHALYGRFPLLVGVLAVLTVILLAKAFGSLLLPLKAVLLNLASVGATYGVIVLVWQPSSTACPWTTRCSSLPGSARNGCAPAPPPLR